MLFHRDVRSSPPDGDGRPHRSSEPVRFHLLLGLVLLSPLPLGSNRPWSWSLLAVCVAVLLMLWSPKSDPRAIPMRPLAWAGGLFSIAVLWAGLQSLPWLPQSWWHPIWDEAAQALSQPLAGSVSVDPSLTLTALCRLLSYAGVFWLAARACRPGDRAFRSMVWLAGACTVYAAYGLADHFLGSEHILWLPKWAYIGDVTGSFVNRNSFGAHTGIGMLACLAIILHALRRRSRRVGAAEQAERMLLRVLPASSGFVILATAQFLSHSRGALLSTLAGGLVLLAASAAARMISGKVLVGLGLVLLAAGAIMLGVSGDVTLARMDDLGQLSNSEESRQFLYPLVSRAVADAAWSGTGYGAFIDAFRFYRDASLSSPLLWDYAHNLYLELAMDLGLPAALALLSSIILLAALCLRGLRARRRNQIYPALSLAALSLLGVHGLVDFSPQIPAIAATLAFLLGLGYAQSWPTDETGQSA